MQVDKAAGKVVNDKGQVYYYHTKQIEGKPHLRCRYFSKNAEGACPIPEDSEVSVNPRTGLPFARKK